MQDFKLGGAHLIFGVFRAKNHDFTQLKIIFFPILGGGWRVSLIGLTWRLKVEKNIRTGTRVKPTESLLNCLTFNSYIFLCQL
jgi:hypothetical protein